MQCLRCQNVLRRVDVREAKDVEHEGAFTGSLLSEYGNPT